MIAQQTTNKTASRDMSNAGLGMTCLGVLTAPAEIDEISHVSATLQQFMSVDRVRTTTRQLMYGSAGVHMIGALAAEDDCRLIAMFPVSASAFGDRLLYLLQCCRAETSIVKRYAAEMFQNRVLEFQDQERRIVKDPGSYDERHCCYDFEAINSCSCLERSERMNRKAEKPGISVIVSEPS